MSGGLLCVWDKSFLVVNLVIQGSRWLCIRGFKQDIACSVAITLAFGPYSSEEKRAFWKELLELKISLDIPLIVIGDFNEITCPKERRGYESMSRLMFEFFSMD